MGAAFRPFPLLFFKPFANDLIHRRLGNGYGDRLPITMASSIVGNVELIRRDIASKLADCFEEFALLRALRHCLQVYLQICDLLERLVDIAMP